MSRHEERIVELIAHQAAQFLAREAGTQSLITVTRAELSTHGERATVYVSIFPEQKVGAALAFLARSRSELRDYLHEHSRLRPLPVVEFALDEGELNRQRLDEIARKP